MLRGNSPAKVDDKGRIKIPTLFRGYLEQTYGRDFFVTSLSGEFVRLYPMPVWMEVERKIAGMSTVTGPAVRFRNFVNYYGQAATMDEQGRVLIHPMLREKSGTDGEVFVIGNLSYLDIWNRETLDARLNGGPLNDDDLEFLGRHGI